MIWANHSKKNLKDREDVGWLLEKWEWRITAAFVGVIVGGGDWEVGGGGKWGRPQGLEAAEPPAPGKVSSLSCL